MKELALVSVCIPVYNSSKTIQQTLDAVLAQTYTHLEIVICDDQSTDNSLEILQAYTDPRIIIKRNKKNLSGLNNFQEVISHSKGKYVKLLCADDIITPDCIEKQVAAFENNPSLQIAMVTAEKSVIDKNNKIVFSKKPFPGRAGYYDGKKAIRKTLRHGTNILGEPGLVLMNGEMLRSSEGCTKETQFHFVIDLDLWFKLLQRGGLYVIKETLFSFRVIPSSVSASIRWSHSRIFIDYLKYARKKMQIPISAMDMVIAKLMAHLMCFARNMVFIIYR